jgi:short-subunit dehydrogenase
LAYFLLTNLLLDVIKESSPARIINVTSRGHKVGTMDLGNLNAEKSYNELIYCQSKLANVLFTYELARKLVGTGVTVNCLHPGIVKSNFGRDGSLFYRFLLTTVLRPFMISPATSPELEVVSGKYFVQKKAVKSSSKTVIMSILPLFCCVEINNRRCSEGSRLMQVMFLLFTLGYFDAFRVYVSNLLKYYIDNYFYYNYNKI